ncbi:MAG TPA: fibronectin type III domain-containing protein [Candidatus Limnocylindria bacterium]|nr:fibronectin type III domain-containing protein [Candidatus Limnocylindria bacterium]
MSVKRMLPAAPCAALLLALAPAADPPARMIVGAIIDSDRYRAYVGDTVVWRVFDTAGQAGLVTGFFRITANGNRIAEVPLSPFSPFLTTFIGYTPYAPGKYITGVYMFDVNGTTAYQFSPPVIVDPRPAPKNVRVEPVSGTALKVAWDAVPGATGYEVWRAEFKAGPYALVRSTAATSWSNTYLTPGKLYWYQVRSTNSVSTIGFNGTAASTLFSAPAGAIPLAKAAITSAAATGKDRVKLVLTPVPGASGYEVQVSSTAGGAYRVLRRVSAATFTLTGLNPDTAYYFRVRAYRTVSAGTFFGPLSGYRGVRTLK